MSQIYFKDYDVVEEYMYSLSNLLVSDSQKYMLK
jgi:hypothetical protein